MEYSGEHDISLLTSQANAEVQKIICGLNKLWKRKWKFSKPKNVMRRSSKRLFQQFFRFSHTWTRCRNTAFIARVFF